MCSCKGFASEDDWIDYCLENDPRFLAGSHRHVRATARGLGVRIEDVAFDDEPQADQ